MGHSCKTIVVLDLDNTIVRLIEIPANKNKKQNVWAVRRYAIDFIYELLNEGILPVFWSIGIDSYVNSVLTMLSCIYNFFMVYQEEQKIFPFLGLARYKNEKDIYIKNINTLASKLASFYVKNRMTYIPHIFHFDDSKFAVVPFIDDEYTYAHAIVVPAFCPLFTETISEDATFLVLRHLMLSIKNDPYVMLKTTFLNKVSQYNDVNYHIDFSIDICQAKEKIYL